MGNTSGASVHDLKKASVKALHESRKQNEHLVQLLGEQRHLYLTTPGDSVFDAEYRMRPPFKIIGTRKPGSSWFLIANHSISLFKNTLKPDIYITYQDSLGRYLGPVKYSSKYVTYGLKAEMSPIRVLFGRLSENYKAMAFKAIPRTVPITGGYDGAFAPFGIGRINFGGAFQGLSVRTLGLALATGVTFGANGDMVASLKSAAAKWTTKQQVKIIGTTMLVLNTLIITSYNWDRITAAIDAKFPPPASEK